MVKTKGVEATVKSWEGSHGVIAGRYKEGIQRSTNWKENALAAKELYNAKIQESIADGRREKGIDRVSPEEWKSAAANKGSARIVQGMKESVGKYRSGMNDVISTIEGTTLPPRTADIDANIERVKVLAHALHDMKRNR